MQTELWNHPDLIRIREERKARHDFFADIVAKRDKAEIRAEKKEARREWFSIIMEFFTGAAMYSSDPTTSRMAITYAAEQSLNGRRQEQIANEERRHQQRIADEEAETERMARAMYLAMKWRDEDRANG